jgi:hypothetical protein
MLQSRDARRPEIELQKPVFEDFQASSCNPTASNAAEAHDAQKPPNSRSIIVAPKVMLCKRSLLKQKLYRNSFQKERGPVLKTSESFFR